MKRSQLNPVHAHCNVRFQVHTAVTINMIIMWDVTPCTLAEIHLRFRGNFYLHLQGEERKSKKEPKINRRKHFSSFFLPFILSFVFSFLLLFLVSIFPPFLLIPINVSMIPLSHFFHSFRSCYFFFQSFHSTSSSSFFFPYFS